MTKVMANFFKVLSSFALLPKCRVEVCYVILAVAAATGILLHSDPSSAREQIRWIALGQAGRLVYGADEAGNRVPDFSTAGYRGGGVKLPDVAAVLSIDKPSGQDDTALIQAALDKLSDRPVGQDGSRGAVQLGPGTFTLKGTLRLSASGVVLRGSGIGKTIIHAKGSPRTVIAVEGKGTWRRSGPSVRIVDRHVAVGAKSVHVENAGAFKVGDRIIVQRPTTKPWIDEIGMNRIPARSKGGAVRQWQPGPGLLFDRTIVGLRDNLIELDAALTNAMSPADGPVVWRYEFAERIRNVGVEHLSVTGSDFFRDPNYRTDTYRQSNFIAFVAIEDGWLRGVAIEDFAVALRFHATAAHFTATDFVVKSSSELKRHGALPASVSIDGQNILIDECRMTGAAYIAWATQSFTPGPNVVRNCSAVGERVLAHMHQRWGTGLLFDNVRLRGMLHIGNRGNAGTGHGWAGANSVAWNSSATTWLVESPPTAYNWAFGMQGRMIKSHEPLGEIISPGKNMETPSLYEQQLFERSQGTAAESHK